ncbi:MAG: Hint domain-containing protein [Paracoccaceae bacterium]
MTRPPHTAPAQNIPVFLAEDFCVTYGANMGDGLSFMSEVELDDIYELDSAATRHRLTFRAEEDGSYRVVDGTERGIPGAPLYLDATFLFMTPDGRNIELLVLVETADDGHLNQVYFLPLAPIEAEVEYRLVGTDRDGARARFAQVANVSFTRGTHITMASGEQVRIEDLKAGDRVLTRDAGPQEIRWIGHTTARATGDFAPILIRAGVLNNENDLLVSPDHRLFVYQRSDQIGVGQSEILVKARHLVNGDSVTVQDGGFVDYFQILFDRHHIIYAEGIAAESMLIDSRTRSALPPDLIHKLKSILPAHGHRADHGFDVQKALLDRPDAIDLLRRASLR